MTLTVIYTDDGRIQALTRSASRDDDAAPAEPRTSLATEGGQQIAQVTLDEPWRAWTLAEIHERCLVAVEQGGPRLRLRGRAEAAR